MTSYEELKEQLRRRLNETCGSLIRKIDRMLMGVGPYRAEIVYIFDVYKYLAFGTGRRGVLNYLAEDVMENMSRREIKRRLKEFGDLQIESIETVIEACDIKQKLTDFIPLESDIEIAERRAERRKQKDILELLEKLKTMSVEEFLASRKSIIKTLRERGYHRLVDKIDDMMENDNRLRNIMVEETQKLARELLGATEKETIMLIERLRC